MPQLNEKLASWVPTLVGLTLVVAILYFTQEVLLPIALATLLSFLLSLPVRWLERRGLARIPSVLAVVLFTFVLIGGVGYLVTLQLVDLAGSLPKYQDTLRHRIQAVRDLTGGDHPGQLAKTVEELQKELKAKPEEKKATDGSATRPLDVRVVETADELPLPLRLARDWAKPLLGPMGTAALVLLFVVFMLLQREDLRDRLIRLAGTGRVYVTTQAMDEAAERVSKFLLMQLLINVSFGLAIAIGLFLIGMASGQAFPNAFLWGLLAAVLRFIPYIGPWVAAAFPITLSLAVYESWGPPLLVVGLFVLNELISNNVFEPWLYGASTGISSVGLIAMAAFWTWLWGPIGLVLSMPLTVVTVVLGRYVPHLNFLNVLLSDEPALDVSVRFYQRLLSFDEHEAGELVVTFLQNGTLDDLYQQVLLPALSLSERDRQNGRLADQQLRFIHRSVRDLASEVKHQFDLSAATRTVPEGAAKEEAARIPAAPTGRSLRIACVPAEDRADRIAGLLLVQLLKARGHQAETLHHRITSAHMATLLESRQPDLVIVTALAPGGAILAREGTARVRSRFPNLHLLIGLWNTRELPERTKERLTAAGADFVTSALKEGLEHVDKLAEAGSDKTAPNATTTDRPASRDALRQPAEAGS